jgi:hypothetical protein
MHGGNETARAVSIERRDFAYVGAADKGALTGAAEDDEPQLRLIGDPAGGLDNLLHQRAVEAVQLAGIVDCHPGEMATLLPLLMQN